MIVYVCTVSKSSFSEFGKNFVAYLKNYVVVCREIGCVTHKKVVCRPTVCTEEVIDYILESMEQEPRKTLKLLPQEIAFSYGTCQTIIKNNMNMHPYTMQPYHALLPLLTARVLLII